MILTPYTIIPSSRPALNVQPVCYLLHVGTPRTAGGVYTTIDINGTIVVLLVYKTISLTY